MRPHKLGCGVLRARIRSGAVKIVVGAHLFVPYVGGTNRTFTCDCTDIDTASYDIVHINIICDGTCSSTHNTTDATAVALYKTAVEIVANECTAVHVSGDTADITCRRRCGGGYVATVATVLYV